MSSLVSYSAAVLTVSDTAALDAATDRSGPAIRALLTPPFKVVSFKIVADDPEAIRRTVQDWCDEGIALILTSGGTGFGVRDRTPESLAPMISKPAPGLVALMMTQSLAITPMAALSRPLAGVYVPPNDSTGKGSLIITLPGSPKGARENLEALLKVLPHALELSVGGSGKETHVKMGGAASRDASYPSSAVNDPDAHLHHHHGHSHGHSAPTSRTMLSKDPSISASSRQRHSPYPMTPIREAMDLIFANTRVNPVQNLAVDDKLLGFVIAEPVFSAKDIPELPTTNVDGYAVRSCDPIGKYRVQTHYGPVAPGHIYRINTGAPLPPGADAVIMVEDTVVISRLSSSIGADDATGEEDEVDVLAQVDVGENVRNPGSDVKSGDQVLEAGDVISGVGGELGTLAFIGKRATRVHRRPVVAVLSTGNELVDVTDTESPAFLSSFSSIPDSNRPSLISILRHLHFDVLDLGIVGDTMEETTRALKKGKEEADVIISTGGTSMGVEDLLKPCIEREMKGTVHFGRVIMKPGKPTTFATIPSHPMSPNPAPRLVFALPGNPASALVTFFLFVLPALRKMEGRRECDWELPRLSVELTSDTYLDSRPEYQRVFLRPSTSRGRGASLKAYSTGGQRSSRTVSLAGANGLLELPQRDDTTRVFRAGETVDCMIIGEIGGLQV